MASKFAEQMVYGLITNKQYYESDLPIEKIKGAISLFYLICDDGNLGEYHDDMIKLHLYLSRIQWERGYHDDAFSSLDEALKSAKALEKLSDGKEYYFSAPLVSFVKCRPESVICENIAKNLPDEWPFWCNPDYNQVEKEIKADPRWHEWVKRTQA